MQKHGDPPPLSKPIAGYIDHTLLKPFATEQDIRRLCLEAIDHRFRAVCVNGCHLELASACLLGSGVSLAAVVGFPLGASTTEAKVCEAKACLASGAGELDVVLNIGWLKSGRQALVLQELRALRESAPEAVLKLILETCYLEDHEKEIACSLALDAGWDFVKTSTGFGSGGATLPDVLLMKKAVGNRMEIKASGGIRDLPAALGFIQAGATRLGTSAGIALVKAYNAMTP